MNRKLGLLLFVLSITASFAQENKTTCNCSDAAYHQFDFWIGEWEVYDTDGRKAGESSITSRKDNCVIFENWSSDKATGESYSYYNTADQSWHQVYIDCSGSVYHFTGKFQNNKMVLRSEKIKGKPYKNTYYQIILQKDTGGTITQFWDITDRKGKVLEKVFHGIYKSKTSIAKTESSRKVTGIGGIFFKSKDPVLLKKWYQDYLGLQTDQYGTNFEWRQSVDPDKKGFTQWSPFHEKTKYFNPSTKDFMINYRVVNLEALLEDLAVKGVTITDKMETYEYGKFVHILDPEGNKIELWEPIDEEYDKSVIGRTR
jgi:predicted enzyme related to lactoylglutathione lyase